MTLALLGVMAVVACHAASNGTPSLRREQLAPLAARSRAFDSSYGDLAIAASSCLVVARETGGAHPEVETFAPDGRRLGRWSAVGSGPDELRAIDGLSRVADSLVVWDRANARLSWLDCHAQPIRSATVPLVGLSVVATRFDTVFFAFDPVLPVYGQWVIAGQPRDTLGPRITPRLRGARDVFAASPDGCLGVLDVSAGVLLRFRPGHSIPDAWDTLPEAIQQPLRSAMRERFPESTAIQQMSVTAMAAPWIQFLGADTLAIGFPALPAGQGIVMVKWPIGEPGAIRVMQPTDSLAALGSYASTPPIVLGDTLVQVGRDSVYRFLIGPP
jgi:hypothetical protein